MKGLSYPRSLSSLHIVHTLHPPLLLRCQYPQRFIMNTKLLHHKPTISPVVSLLKRGGSLEDALSEFMKDPSDTFGASMLISRQNHLSECFSTYHLLCKNTSPDVPVMMSLIQSCRKKGQPHRAEPLLDDIFQLGVIPESKLFGSLLMASLESKEKGRNTSIVVAKKILDQMKMNKVKDISPQLCSLLIRSFSSSNTVDGLSNSMEVLQFMDRMKIKPDGYVYNALFTSCANSGSLEHGKKIHQHLMKSGIGRDDLQLNTSLINMYSKCGSVEDSNKIFDHLRLHRFKIDIVTYT